MEKFEHVDVLAALRRIMEQNTDLNRRYFDSSASLIWANAVSDDKYSNSILWMNHQSGVECFREREVFLRDTWPNACWQGIGDRDHGRILAYAIELAEAKGDIVYGDIYPLDYAAHSLTVEQESLVLDAVELTFQNGDVYFCSAEDYKKWDREIRAHYGDYQKLEHLVSEPERLDALLERHQAERSHAVAGQVDSHIRKLRLENVQQEATQILSKLQTLEGPNSPNGTHFMVEISPRFLQNASSKDQSQLFRMLPFSTLTFSGLKDRHGLYALISKDEDRNKPLRKPSVRKKLNEKADTGAVLKPPKKSKAKEQER